MRKASITPETQSTNTLSHDSESDSDKISSISKVRLSTISGNIQNSSNPNPMTNFTTSKPSSRPSWPTASRVNQLNNKRRTSIAQVANQVTNVAKKVQIDRRFSSVGNETREFLMKSSAHGWAKLFEDYGSGDKDDQSTSFDLEKGDFQKDKKKSLKSTCKNCFNFITKNKNILIRSFWAIILLLSICGLIIMINARVITFKSNRASSPNFVTSVKPGPNSTLPFPSISVCTEGYLTEFLIRDLEILLRERIDFYYDRPEQVVIRALHYDTTVKIRNYVDNVFVHYFIDYIKRDLTLAYEKEVIKYQNETGSDLNYVPPDHSSDSKCIKTDVHFRPFINYQTDVNNMELFQTNISKIETAKNVTFCTEYYNNITSLPMQKIENLNLNFIFDQGGQPGQNSDSKIFKNSSPLIKDFFEMAFFFAVWDLDIDLISDDVDHENKHIYILKEHKKMLYNYGQYKTLLFEKLSDIWTKTSKYAQFYKPKNIIEQILKLRKMTSLGMGGWSNFKPLPGPVDGELNFVLDSESVKVSENFHFDRPVAYKYHDHLKPSRYSNFKNIFENQNLENDFTLENAQNNFEENLKFSDYLDDFSLEISESIQSAKLFDLTISDFSKAKGINMSKQINFDASCIRFDFDQENLRQNKRGIENGFKLVLKIPKSYEGDFEGRLKSRSFPRREVVLTPKGVLDYMDEEGELGTVLDEAFRQRESRNYNYNYYDLYDYYGYDGYNYTGWSWIDVRLGI